MVLRISQKSHYKSPRSQRLCGEIDLFSVDLNYATKNYRMAEGNPRS